MHLHNRKFFKPIRKHLRNNSTAAESILWKMLQKRQLGGYKFRRQHSIVKYVVDFFCYELMLIIELEGEAYTDLYQLAKDEERDAWLSSEGFSVLRYENRWVYEYAEVIIEDILEHGEKMKK